MAIRLSHHDLDVCSRALRELYADPSLQAFPDRLLPLVARLIPSGHLSYNEFDELRGRFIIRYHPERPDAGKLIPQFAAHRQTHPLWQHYNKIDGIPKRISDEATLRQFEQTAVYQEYYRLMGTRHQIICFFPRQGGKDALVGLALNREKTDFSERDLGVLEFLSPHIAQAHQNAQAADAMAVRLETVGDGLDTMRRAVILAGPDGEIHWQSALAREWLREFFPEERTIDRLPPAILQRLSRMEKSSVAGQPAFSDFQSPARGDCRLLVYCGKTRSGEYVLALIRERAKLDDAAGHAFGLTPREAEILFWISEAKTRPEIGTILGVSWRTIGKHMEHLFEKLGVENRLEAQRIGSELRRI